MCIRDSDEGGEVGRQDAAAGGRGEGIDFREDPQLVQAAEGSEVEEERTETAPGQAEGEAPRMLRRRRGLADESRQGRRIGSHKYLDINEWSTCV